MAVDLQARAEAAYRQLSQMSQEAEQLLIDDTLADDDRQALSAIKFRVDEAAQVAKAAALKRAIVHLDAQIAALTAERDALARQLRPGR